MATARSRRRLAVVFALVLTTGTLVSVPAGAQDTDDSGGFTLTILHNNDGESKLLPDENDDPGVARFVALMKQLQAGASGTGLITLTSGDNFLASQELGVSLAREGPLYDSIALSGIYDAMALGNHDFDLGPEVTARFVSGFSPPVTFLSANMDFSGEPALQALVDRGPDRSQHGHRNRWRADRRDRSGYPDAAQHLHPSQRRGVTGVAGSDGRSGEPDRPGREQDHPGQPSPGRGGGDRVGRESLGRGRRDRRRRGRPAPQRGRHLPSRQRRRWPPTPSRRPTPRAPRCR